MAIRTSVSTLPEARLPLVRSTSGFTGCVFVDTLCRSLMVPVVDLGGSLGKFRAVCRGDILLFSGRLVNGVEHATSIGILTLELNLKDLVESRNSSLTCQQVSQHRV